MILLARHGRTAYNDEGRFQGQGPVPLDDHGRQQALALADVIAQRGDVTRMVASPVTRALETAAIVGARIGLAPEVDLRWAETDCGSWRDRSYAEVQAADPDGYAAFRRQDLGFAAPGGETFGHQQERVVEALRAVRATGAGAGAGAGVTLVVCHRNVLRLLLLHEHGVDPGHDAIPNTHLITL